jgi:hypothetical protein
LSLSVTLQTATRPLATSCRTRPGVTPRRWATSPTVYQSFDPDGFAIAYRPRRMSLTLQFGAQQSPAERVTANPPGFMEYPQGESRSRLLVVHASGKRSRRTEVQ